jgi:hypothetical protein
MGNKKSVIDDEKGFLEQLGEDVMKPSIIPHFRYATI